MPNIQIHINGVPNLLQGIKAHKARRPDQITARLLKDAANQLAPIMTTNFKPIINNVYQQLGNKPTLSQCTKRETTPHPGKLTPNLSHSHMLRGYGCHDAAEMLGV